MSRYNVTIILLLAAAFVLLNLVGLDRMPIVHWDEVTVNDAPKELALHGKFQASVFLGMPGFDNTYLMRPPGQPLVMATVYKLFGFGIWQTRVPGVVFGAATLVALYLVAMELFNNRRAAFFAAILFALDPNFLLTARMGRPDTQGLFLALLGVVFYLRAEAVHDRRYFWLACSGLSVGVAGIVQPVVVAWPIGIGLLIVLNKDWGLKGFTLFAMLAGLPSIVWVAHALGTPEAFLGQFWMDVEWHIAEGSFFARLFQEVLRYGPAYQRVPLLLLMYSVALPWLMLNRRYPRTAKIKMLVLFIVPFLFNSFVLKKTIGFYILYPATILAVASGVIFAGFLPGRTIELKGVRHLAAAALVFLAGINLAGVSIFGRYLGLAVQWRERDYQQVEAPILESIPKGVIVRGPPEVWYAMERAGASLRIVGGPDPRLHDYVIIKRDSLIKAPLGFHKIREIGGPLTPVLGMFKMSHSDYRMEIWQSDYRR